jgi:hypothetical protein
MLPRFPPGWAAGAAYVAPIWESILALRGLASARLLRMELLLAWHVIQITPSVIRQTPIVASTGRSDLK